MGGVINNRPAQPSVKKPQTPDSFTKKLGDGVTLDMVYIPEGDFLMGSPENEAGRRVIEGPQHRVYLPAFFMGKYPVTQAQWKAVAKLKKTEKDLASDPFNFKGNDLPVEQVS